MVVGTSRTEHAATASNGAVGHQISSAAVCACGRDSADRRSRTGTSLRSESFSAAQYEYQFGDPAKYHNACARQ